MFTDGIDGGTKALDIKSLQCPFGVQGRSTREARRVEFDGMDGMDGWDGWDGWMGWYELD